MSSSIQRCLVMCVLLVACADGTPSARRSAQAAAPSRPDAGVTAAPAPRDATPLAERLLREASEHPEARAEVERQLAAFGETGVQFTRTRQALARPLAAHYCATAMTTAGLALAVCAFPSPEAADAGRRRSHAMFDALIPGRTLLVQRSTLLTFTRPATEPARLELERVRARFTRAAAEEHAAL